MSLEKLEPTFEPTMFRSLKTIALQHKKRLFATFGLVSGKSAVVDLSFDGQFCGECGAKQATGFRSRLRLNSVDYLGRGGGSPCGGHPCLHSYLHGTCRASDFEPKD